MPNYKTYKDYWGGSFEGDTAYVKYGHMPPDTVKVFKHIDSGLYLDPMTIRPGFGILPEGTLMAEIASPVKGQPIYVPYTKVTPAVGDDADYGKVLLTRAGDATTGIYVSLNDSYCFLVGDKLRVVDADTASVDLGAVTAIDRTTYPNEAKITVTNACPATMTTAGGASVSIQTKSTTPFTKAVGVLTGGVDTGLGVNAKGGGGTVIVSGVMVYAANIPNLDDAAVTDLGASKMQANRLLVIR